MAHSPLMQVSAAFGEEVITLEEVKLHAARLGDPGHGNGTPRIFGPPMADTPSTAAQGAILGGRPEFHRCVPVGQAEERARDPDRDGPVAVQRQEIDPGESMAIAHIQSDIEFPEVRQPRHGRQPPGANRFHQESHDAHMGDSQMDIQCQTRGQQGFQALGPLDPVEKKQVAPALVHHGAGVRRNLMECRTAKRLNGRHRACS